MSRKPTPPAAAVAVLFNQDAYEADSNAATTLGEHQAVAVAEAQRIADQFSYRGDLTLEAVENQMDREGHTHAVSGLAFGASLLIMRALCPHGQFIQRVEARGHNRRAAQRAMSVALRFSKSDKLSFLRNAASSQSKLLELSFLDDEDLVVLDQGGEVSGITLDKVETMTASELRAALRKERQDRDADKQLLQRKSDRITALQDKVDRFKAAPPDEQMVELQKQATEAMRDALGCIRGSVRAAVKGIQDAGGSAGRHDRFLAGLLAELQAALADVRQEANLPDVSNAAELAAEAESRQWADPTANRSGQS